ncbi:hypothetical protein ACFQ6V_14910 [Streptomyces roseifaciens]
MSIVYFNSSVQNGNFTLAAQPGKAVDIRLAEALNAPLGVGPVPHLWNTVTLAGDIRHRSPAGRDSLGQAQREERAVATKYAAGPLPRQVGCSPTPIGLVAAVALEMVEGLLSDGSLARPAMRPLRAHDRGCRRGLPQLGAASSGTLGWPCWCTTEVSARCSGARASTPLTLAPRRT